MTTASRLAILAAAIALLWSCAIVITPPRPSYELVPLPHRIDGIVRQCMTIDQVIEAIGYPPSIRDEISSRTVRMTWVAPGEKRHLTVMCDDGAVVYINDFTYSTRAVPATYP